MNRVAKAEQRQNKLVLGENVSFSIS